MKIGDIVRQTLSDTGELAYYLEGDPFQLGMIVSVAESSIEEGVWWYSVNHPKLGDIRTYMEDELEVIDLE